MIHKQKLFILVSLIFVSALSAHAQNLCSWQDIIQNSLGQGNPNATVIVLSGTIGGARAVNTTTQPGTPLATIYADPYGATQINQTTGPLTTAAGNGWFQFWTACNSYVVIQAYGLGINGQLVYGVFVGSVSQSSISATAPIVVSPNPITGTGIISCPTCGSGGGTWFNVTNSPYNAVADGSTDNSTAIASVFTASNAVTLGTPTVYFPCQSGKGCKYNYGGAGVSPINPLIPTTIQCDTGVVLNYIGSAHAVDVGPTGLSTIQGFNGFYKISGCKFTDSGSETEGIFFNPWIAYTEVDHNTFYDTPASGSATAWAILYSGDGNNFWMHVHDNFFAVDDGVPSNFLKSASSTNLDSILYFHNNVAGCITAPEPAGVLCNASQGGIGVVFNGVGSELFSNLINAMNPAIEFGQLAGGSSMFNNQFEPPLTASGTTPVIQYGFSTDMASTPIEGIKFTDNYMYGHGSSPFLAPGSANDFLVNTSIKGMHLGGFSQSGPATLIVENSSYVNGGPNGNVMQGYECPKRDEGTGGALVCPPFHNFNASAISPWPWKILDGMNYSDGFNRADGALTTPWVAYQGGTSATITSDVALGVGANSGNMYGVDAGPNYRAGIIFNTIPTGTDFISIHFRAQNAVNNAGNNLYECAYINGTGIQMYKELANVSTQLGSTWTTTTPIAGDLMEAEAINNTLTCYLNGRPVVNAVDSSISFGYSALVFGGTSGKVSSFTVRGLP